MFFVLNTAGHVEGSTVSIRASNAATADLVIGLLELTQAGADCANPVCLDTADVGLDGDPETLTVTIGATPFTGLVNIDSFNFAPMEGVLTIEVVFSDEVVAGSVCDSNDADVCADAEVLSCSTDESTQTRARCEFGCSTDNSACASAVLGESCADPLVVRFPGPGETLQIPTDTSDFADDLVGSCDSGGEGGDGVFSFVAAFSATMVISHSGFDGILYVSENTCGGVELTCDDGFLEDSITFDVVGGRSYFVVLDAFFAGDEGSTVLSFGFAP